jgi:hypothetical protein
MLSLRSRYSLKQENPERLILRTNPMRRGLFFFIAVLLLVSFLLGFDPARDLNPPRLGGTVFYFILLAVSLGTGLWEKRFIFDKKKMEFLTRVCFGKLPVIVSEPVGLLSITSVVLQQLRLIPEGALRKKSGGKTLTGTVLDRKKMYYKLFLQIGDRRRLLEEASSSEELEEIGKTLAAFLGAVFEYEEV